MVGKTKAATAAQKRRMAKIKELGCLACRADGRQVNGEAHHLIEGYRAGHDETISLCCWHHRGQPWTIDQRPSEMKIIAGPSLALHKREFIQRYGTERELLDEQNRLLEDA